MSHEPCMVKTTPVRRSRQIYWVTGTDTDVGKTTVTAALLARATIQGHRCYGIKPISAGCLAGENGWVSPDALQIQAQASVKLHEDLLAPIKLPLPISPHLAAAEAGVRLTASRLVGLLRGGLSTPATHILIEGAGGWRVPINERETLADVAKQLQYPVILVVGIRLGCLNHALLTADAIVADGLTLAGWVANICQHDVPFAEAQIETLKQRFDAPCLGIIPYDQQATAVQRADVLSWPHETSTDPR
jgi:dethiobiotin synthetase